MDLAALPGAPGRRSDRASTGPGRARSRRAIAAGIDARGQLPAVVRGQLPGLLGLEPPTRRLFRPVQTRASRTIAGSPSDHRLPRRVTPSCGDPIRSGSARIRWSPRQRPRGAGRQVHDHGSSRAPGHDRSGPTLERGLGRPRHRRADRQLDALTQSHKWRRIKADSSTYTFCRDFPDEDFALFYVVLSNHAWSRIANGAPDPAAAVTGFYNVKAQDHCDVPIAYRGTFKVDNDVSVGTLAHRPQRRRERDVQVLLDGGLLRHLTGPADRGQCSNYCYELDSAQETWTAPEVSDRSLQLLPARGPVLVRERRGAAWEHRHHSPNPRPLLSPRSTTCGTETTRRG